MKNLIAGLLVSAALVLWVAPSSNNAQVISGDKLTGTTPAAPPPVECDITAASAAGTAVETAVDAASDGDTVCVPAGSATWGGRVDVGTKSVSVIGAGAGQTIITGGGFHIGEDCTTATNNTRISGFTFLSSGDYTFDIYGAQGWRIDHNTITYPSAFDMLFALGCTGTGGVEGVFDNNTVTYGRVVYFGESNSQTGGSRRYAEALNIGTDHALYVEDNDITWPDGSSGGYLNHIDGNLGCRYVMRYNDVNNGRFEAHALQGDEVRGCRMWEIYGNNITNSGTPGFRPFLIRGGTGVIFDNVTDGGHSGNNTIQIDNPRTHQDDVIAQMGPWGACDDTVDTPQVDAHESGGEGYLCRDQIGSSTDASFWSNYANAGPTQAKYPARMWHNTNTNISGEMVVTLNCVGSMAQCDRQLNKHVVENRDWYQTAASFTGATGIGRGARASRPSTCTTGVAYWSTDGGGNWNSSTSNPFGIQQNGADGGLDVCTATNTWTNDFYIPYSYPHPLRNGS